MGNCAAPVALVLALFSASLLAESRDLSSHSLPITIYTQFSGDYSHAALEAMQAEVAAIMDPLGIHFTWRDLKSSPGNEVSAELAVATFKGHCAAATPILGTAGSGALGWTHTSDGEILPFTDVDCDRLRRFLAAPLFGVETGERENVFGRAMGRVLAHELYHIFANTRHHGAHGVAKAFFSTRDLVSDHFQFEDKEFRSLRKGRLRRLVRPAREPLPTSAAGGQ